MTILPPAIERVRAWDPTLADALATAFGRLTIAAEAMVWAQDRLPALVAAPTASAVLEVVTAEAWALTGAPHVYAVAWDGADGPTRRIRAVSTAAGASTAVAADLPLPEQLSGTLLERVAREGAPAWADDAVADARFDASRSVHAMQLRSVGCVPIGDAAALYVAHPGAIGVFGPDARVRLAALGRLAGVVLAARDDAPAPEPSEIPVEAVPGLIGATPPMRALAADIRAFAPMPWPVLILGETGTGKEVAARALHRLSPLRDEPFVAVNCGAIPAELAESTLFGHERGAFTGADRRREGVFESVGSGTLLLDEIGELPAPVQVKLLRVLQERTFTRVGASTPLTFQGRVLAATHRDLVGTDRFREDLYHRLSACIVRTPPLRDRRGDIPALAAYLLERATDQLPDAPDLTLAPAALRALSAHGWPGNVRELENALRGAVAQAMARGDEVLDVHHFGAALRPTASRSSRVVGDLVAATEQFQREQVRAALALHDGNRTRAAEALGVSRQWLHRLLKRWGDAA